MVRFILLGYALNAIGIAWFCKRIIRAPSLMQTAALLLQAVPYAGFFFIYFFFVWEVPPKQPRYLRCRRSGLYQAHLHDHLVNGDDYGEKDKKL